MSDRHERHVSDMSAFRSARGWHERVGGWAPPRSPNGRTGASPDEAGPIFRYLAGFGGGGGGASALAVGAGLGAGGAGFGGGGDGDDFAGAGFGGGGDDDLADVEAGGAVLVPLGADADALLDAVADGADPLIPALPEDWVWPDAPLSTPPFDQAGGPAVPGDRGGAAAGEELAPAAGCDPLSPGGVPPLRSSPGGTASACAASMTGRVVRRAESSGAETVHRRPAVGAVGMRRPGPALPLPLPARTAAAGPMAAPAGDPAGAIGVPAGPPGRWGHAPVAVTSGATPATGVAPRSTAATAAAPAHSRPAAKRRSVSASSGPRRGPLDLGNLVNSAPRPRHPDG
jgi:hypothetical protein